jgi:hypothetical protein
MGKNKIFPVFASAALTLSILACSLGAPAPSADEPDSPSPDAASLDDSSPVTSSACDNPLHPVAAGASWTYTLSGFSNDTFVRSIIAVDAAGFTDQDVFASGVTRTGEWKCDGGALIALSPNGGATASVQTTGLDSSFETTAHSGVTLPASVNAGDTWSQELTVEGAQDINGVEAQSKNVTSYSCTAGGVEPVTVPAGAFEAQRVDCQIHMAITVIMNGLEVPTAFDSTYTVWYAPGVGMVRTDSLVSGMGDSTLELTAYSIP